MESQNESVYANSKRVGWCGIKGSLGSHWWQERQDRNGINIIPEDMLLSLAEKETSKEVWDTIKIMFMGAYRVKTAKNRDIDGRDWVP